PILTSAGRNIIGYAIHRSEIHAQEIYLRRRSVPHSRSGAFHRLRSSLARDSRGYRSTGERSRAAVFETLPGNGSTRGSLCSLRVPLRRLLRVGIQARSGVAEMVELEEWSERCCPKGMLVAKSEPKPPKPDPDPEMPPNPPGPEPDQPAPDIIDPV